MSDRKQCVPYQLMSLMITRNELRRSFQHLHMLYTVAVLMVTVVSCVGMVEWIEVVFKTGLHKAYPTLCLGSLSL